MQPCLDPLHSNTGGAVGPADAAAEWLQVAAAAVHPAAAASLLAQQPWDSLDNGTAGQWDSVQRGGTAAAAHAALETLEAQAQAEQAAFCAALAAGEAEPGNDIYLRKADVVALGGGAPFPMWILGKPDEDYVTRLIYWSGAWEVDETRAILGSLRAWSEVRHQ